MITKISRGFVEAQVGNKTVTILGEGLLRMEGQLDYVIYKDSIECWDGPAKEPIDSVTREAILADVLVEMQERGMTVEVE
jgi:hypothetical protein